MKKLKVGAVIYDPKVTVIWGIIEKFFEDEGFPIETIYYKDYKAQVDGLLEKEIDVAWNSPLAWLDSHLRMVKLLTALCEIPTVIEVHLL